MRVAGRGRRAVAVTAAVAGLAAAAAAAGVGLAAAAGLEPMRVQGDSMRPTLRPGQRVAVGPLRGPPPRGAGVVLRHPTDDRLELVKRVAGLPGERLRLDDGRQVALGEGEYLVLGDHRTGSTDGRAFGPVRAEQLVGVVRFAYWPPRRLRPRAG